MTWRTFLVHTAPVLHQDVPVPQGCQISEDPMPGWPHKLSLQCPVLRPRQSHARCSLAGSTSCCSMVQLHSAAGSSPSEDWAFQPQRNSVHSFRQWTSCWQEVARLLILGSVSDPLCDLRQITSLWCASSTSRLSSVLSVWLQALGGGWVCSTNHRRALISVGTLSTVQNLQLFCSPYCLH